MVNYCSMKKSILKIFIFLNIILCLILLVNQIKGFNRFPNPSSEAIAADPSLEINTLSFTFYGPSEGVSIFNDGIVFLSNSKFHQKMIPDHISFGKTRTYFTLIENTDLSKGKPFLTDDAFPYLPESMAFTQDLSTIYFTQKLEIKGTNEVEKIYSVKIISKENSNKIDPRGRRYVLLPFCNDTCSYMYPTLSNNDSIMIFASDRKSTLGKLDLFITKKQGSEWGEPENLGERINSKSNEKYPFLDSKNNLFFSSEGRSGYGGYDIYVCKFTGNGWGMPLNLMKGINSKYDEVAFSIHPDQNVGFYSVIMTSKKQQKLLYKMQVNMPEMLSLELINRALVMYENLYGEKMNIDLLAYEMKKDEPVKEIVLIESEPVEENKRAEELKRTEELKKAEDLKIKEESNIEVKPEPEIKDETVVFRVQILSTMKPKTNFIDVVINNKKYQIYEYLYLGEYRYTIGYFQNLEEAAELQKICRNSGYNQAFVAAFRNNERVTDLSVFKKN